MSNTLNGLYGYALPNTLDNLNIIDDLGNEYLLINGSNSMLADLDMNNHNIKNLDNAVSNDEAVNLGQVNSLLSNYVDLTTIQTVGGIKRFYDIPSGEGIIALGRTATSNNIALRYTNNIGSTLWSVGNEADLNDNFIISKDGIIKILTINYSTPSLDLNNYKIINLNNAVNNDEAVNLGQVNTLISGFVTLTTAQNITGVKTLTGGTNAQLNINRGLASSFAFNRFQSLGSNIWDVGLYATTNQYYWFHSPTSNLMMALTTSGSLGIGTINPTDKLQVENGSIIINRTDNLPALINMTTNSASAVRGSVISCDGINSRGQGIVYANTNNTSVKWFSGRPYSGGGPTESRFVIGYNGAGIDPVEERSGGGVTRYIPHFVGDGVNSRVGILTTTPLVPCHITGDTRITNGTLHVIGDILAENSTAATTNCLIARNRFQAANTNTSILFRNGITGNVNSGHQASIVSGHTTGGNTFIAFRTNSGAGQNVDVERMRIDQTGNVSILTGTLNMTNNKIINVATPTLGTDATNKDYIDNNFVTLSTMQIINGSKFFYDGTQDGQVSIVRASGRSAGLALFEDLVGLQWYIGQAGNANFSVRKDNLTEILTVNYATPSLSVNNYNIINVADAVNNTDAVNLQQLRNSVTLATTVNFTYNNEDVVKLESSVARTISFDNVGLVYRTGKRFELIISNTAIGNTTFTLSLTAGTLTFPDGTNSKTQTIAGSTIKRYNCVIDNFSGANHLFISELTYI